MMYFMVFYRYFYCYVGFELSVVVVGFSIYDYVERSVYRYFDVYEERYYVKEYS